MPDDKDDPDKTPVRSPSGLRKLGHVPCPKCTHPPYIYECDLCLNEDGFCTRGVPLDVAVRWTKEPHKSRFQIEADRDRDKPPKKV